MLKIRSMLRSLHVFVAILWPTITFAAASTFGSTFEGIGLTAWLMVIVLSTVAGMTAILNRIASELRAIDAAPEEGGKPKLPSIWLFIASNLFGSWLTGLFFFLICEHFDVPDFLEAAAVIGASYAGARLIERTMEGVVDKAIDRLGVLFGSSRAPTYEPRTSRYEDREPPRRTQYDPSSDRPTPRDR